MMTDNDLLGETREYLTCDNEDCGKMGARMRCSACKMQYYCSKACQKAAWKNHKVLCRHFQKQADETDIKIRAILEDPSPPKPEPTYGANSCCAICLEEEQSVPIKLSCKHHFCYECIKQHTEYLILEGKYPEPVNMQLANTKCPVCRADTLPFDTLSCLRDESSIYSDHANFIQQHRKNIPNAEALIEESISKAAAVLDTAIEETKNDPFYIHLAFKRAELALAMGDYDLGASLMAESKKSFLGDGMNSYTMDDPNGRANFYNHFRLHAHFLLHLGRAQEAKKVLQDGVQLVGDDMGMFPKIDRDFYADFTWCLYELGEYEKAIDLGTSALIEMNRTYQQCHKYVALSQKAMGCLDDAITTMRQAVCYETPWDEANVDEARELLRELLAERSSIE